MAACPTPATGANFIGTTLRHLDCQAENIGAEGYRALIISGSPLMALLTGMLTLYIALIGFRMLRGQMPSMNDLTVSALKIGIVLALATGWANQRAGIYDAVLRAPAEISNSVSGGAGLPGAQTGLIVRLQSADDAITKLMASGSGRNDLSAAPPTGTNLRAPPPLFSDDFALGLGRTAFVSSLVGGIGLLRLLGGSLLAMLPLFAGFLLFETMRWLFFGWLRSMSAVLIGSVVVAIVVGVELAILEPWLADVLTQRAARRPTIDAPFELFALTLSFWLILFGSLLATTWLSFSSNVSTWVTSKMEHMQQSISASQLFNRIESGPRPILQEPANETAERAFLIAQSVSAAERRDAVFRGERSGVTIAATDRRAAVPGTGSNNSAGQMLGAVPLGQSYRRTARRISAATQRRSAAT